jgi:predicted acetyltransferase
MKSFRPQVRRHTARSLLWPQVVHDFTLWEHADVDLRLRPLRHADEAQARAAQRELAPEGFQFLMDGYVDGEPWDGYRERVDRRRFEPGPGMVPGTLLVAEVDGEIVGRVSIRHELNEMLRRVAGHIGYGVRPQHRRRGFATEILRQSLIVARSLGIDAVLVTCDEGNVASMTVIERCGGVLENVLDIPGEPSKRRYWIS